MPTGKKGKGRKPHRKTKPPGPLSECKLPHDVVLNILSRLPVKTLLQFRSVCKPWKTLIRSPKFIAHHLYHHSAAASTTTPSLLLTSFHKPTSENKFSLFSLQPPLNLTSRSFLDHSFPIDSPKLDMDVLGTHNGVICTCLRLLGEFISIFNPATKRFLPICSPKQKYDENLHELVSLGFGYDPVRDCYKVLRIHSVYEGLKVQSDVQVYSTDLGVWKKIEIKGPKIRFLETKPEVVVKGIPYWLGFVDDDYGSRFVLLWFDVHNEVFHNIPMLMMPTGIQQYICLVDWKGEFAILGFPKREEEAEESPFVDVWVIEDDGVGVEWWTKKCRMGPFWGLKCVLGCSRNGQIVGKDGEGNLCMYDPETGVVEKFGVDGETEHKFGVFNYSESLVSFKGEKPIEMFSKDDPKRKPNNRTCLHGKFSSESDGNSRLVVPTEDNSFDWIEFEDLVGS